MLLEDKKKTESQNHMLQTMVSGQRECQIEFRFKMVNTNSDFLKFRTCYIYYLVMVEHIWRDTHTRYTRSGHLALQGGILSSGYQSALIWQDMG